MESRAVKTISPDLRTRILSACDRYDRTRRHAADRFGVSPAFVKKLLGRRKRTGFAVNLYFRTGRKQAVSTAKRELMRKYIAKHPGATLAEIARTRRPACSVATVDNTLRRMGLTYKKKTLGAAGRDCADTASERESRNRLSKNRDPSKTVFTDGSGVTAKMTSLYGRAMRVERACDAAPHGHWCVRTLIGPVRGDCETACTAIDSPADKDVFPAHVRKIPAPSLRPGDVVVQDSIRSRNVPGVVETVQSAGADVLHLPPHSPDLNPIEKMRGKIKTTPRAVSAMASPGLHRAIRTAFRQVTREDAISWSASCGCTFS